MLDDCQNTTYIVYPMDQEASDIVLFFGRFHPLILHLPIGFLAIAFLLEILSRFDRFKSYQPAVEIILLLGAGSAVVAAGLGYLLAQGGGYNDDLLALHQWLGIGVAVASVLSFVLLRQARSGKPLMDKAYVSVFSVTVLALMGAGHYGGSLTHGSDYLTQYMPSPLRKVAGLPPKASKEVKKITNLDEAVVYADIIHPILESRCVSCHNDDKKKGELMMHTVQALAAGGENGPIFVVGNADESHMIQRVHLPKEDEEHMPPEGKSQLSDEQVTLLTWWINEGASFDKKVAELTADDETKAVLATLVDPDANKTDVEKLLASPVAPADEATLAQLEETGVSIMPLAADVSWLQASLPARGSGDSLVSALSPVAEQLTWLDLGNTQTTDEALKALPAFKNLTRLHLENTQVSDAGLQYLKDLPYLEYLNLYGTQISDEGLKPLAGLKNLRKIYLWRTQVTPEAATRLKEASPTLEVNMGLEAIPQDSVKAAGSADEKKETVSAGAATEKLATVTP